MPAHRSNTAIPSFARRCAALAYDGLLLAALWMAVSALLLALSGGWLAEPERPLWLVYALRTSLVLVTGLFFGVFWTHGGQTVNEASFTMRTWRLRLVNSADGRKTAPAFPALPPSVNEASFTVAGPVRWKQALLRLAAACLSAGALGLGFFWVLIDRERRSWHDRLSGTQLVVVPAKNP